MNSLQFGVQADVTLYDMSGAVLTTKHLYLEANSQQSAEIKDVLNAAKLYAQVGSVQVLTPGNSCYVGGVVRTVQPNYIDVNTDTVAIRSCSIGSTETRKLNYNVIGTNGFKIARQISVFETVNPGTVSNCNGIQVSTSTSATCTPVPAGGNFTDTLSPGCPTTQQLNDSGCGYTFPDQKWVWCNPAGTNVNLGDVGTDTVHNNLITSGGHSNSIPPGQSFPH